MQSAIEKFKTNYRLQRRIIVVLFTIVPVALLLVFSYLPLVKMIQYSFTDWDGISANSHFVGLQNYKTVLTNPQYIQVFKVSLYYFAVAILRQFFLTRLSSLIYGRDQSSSHTQLTVLPLVSFSFTSTSKMVLWTRFLTSSTWTAGLSCGQVTVVLTTGLLP